MGKKAQTEMENCLRMGNCLKVVDQEMCFKRAEHDQARAENEKLKEVQRERKGAQEGSQLGAIGSSDYRRTKNRSGKLEKTMKEKLTTLRHWYNTRSKTKHMEHANGNLEQQNLDLKGEIGQMKEWMNKMFELLTQGAALNAATIAQGSLTYPPKFTLLLNRNIHPYGMPQGWNANTEEKLAAEEHEQARMNNAGTKPTQGIRNRPRANWGPTSRRPEWTNWTDSNDPKGDSSGRGKLNLLEECLRVIEGTESHGLDVVDLCLVLDVGLPADFKTPKFEKYKGRSYPRVHLAMYCRKMTTYIHQDKILVHFSQDNLTGATLS
ncbi:hypothetical protein CR513_04611, partial [Mucuna pruriens]